MITNKKESVFKHSGRKGVNVPGGERLSDLLHARGLRVTPQKLAVLSVVQWENSHPTPDMVFAEVRQQFPMISLGTVYQILEQFSQLGVVRKIFSGGNRQRFDGNGAPHAHFVCEECGQIDDIDDPFVSAFQKRFARKFDFHIRNHYFEFSGVCARCVGRAKAHRRSK
jgi:Fur family peroxide stress response transcriptional regulator